MRLFYKLIICLCLGLNIFDSYADQSPKLYALHINGVDTTSFSADNNLKALMSASKIKYTNNAIVWDVIYNPTRSGDIESGTVKWGLNLFNNVLDVFYQKRHQGELKNITLDIYTEMYMALVGLNYTKGSKQYIKLQQTLQPLYVAYLDKLGGSNSEQLKQNFHNIVAPPLPVAQSLIQLMNKDATNTYDYSRSLDSVLLIPHSQGNLYANYLYQYLTEVEHMNTKHIAIYGVASPASYNLGDWPVKDEAWEAQDLMEVIQPVDSYITSCSDKVINSLAAEQVFNNYSDVLSFIRNLDFEPTMKCNYSNQTTQANNSNLGHLLTGFYLKDLGMRAQIAKMLNYYAYQLNFYMLKDVVANMEESSGKYHQFPQSATLVAGFTRDSLQKLTDADGKQICNNDRCSASVSRVMTPILDSYVESYGFSFGNFPARLTHYALLPNQTANSESGYNDSSRYLVLEPKKAINAIYWPYLIYPAAHIQALGVINIYEDGILTGCDYKYISQSSEIGDQFDGIYKVFNSSNPLVADFQYCASTFSNLWLGKNWLIDGIYQKQAMISKKLNLRAMKLAPVEYDEVDAAFKQVISGTGKRSSLSQIKAYGAM